MSTTAEKQPLYTVVGGTGFLGRRVVAQLVRDGCRVRIVARKPERDLETGAVESVAADIRDGAAVKRALDGSCAVVNAVSLYAERPGLTFDDIHVRSAHRLAEHAAAAGVRRFVQISGIGSDPRSADRYICARGRGEEAVQDGFPDPVLVRPAPMYDAGEGFLAPILALLKSPVFPLFGRGSTLLEPADARDVASAIASAMQCDAVDGRTYDLAGPETYTYRDLVQALADAMNRHPVLMSVPFSFWTGLARLAERLPGQPLTRHQVALMRRNKVASDNGMQALSVTPRPLSGVLERMAAAG